MARRGCVAPAGLRRRVDAFLRHGAGHACLASRGARRRCGSLAWCRFHAGCSRARPFRPYPRPLQPCQVGACKSRQRLRWGRECRQGLARACLPDLRFLLPRRRRRRLRGHPADHRRSQCCAIVATGPRRHADDFRSRQTASRLIARLRRWQQPASLGARFRRCARAMARRAAHVHESREVPCSRTEESPCWPRFARTLFHPRLHRAAQLRQARLLLRTAPHLTATALSARSRCSHGDKPTTRYGRSVAGAPTPAR